MFTSSLHSMYQLSRQHLVLYFLPPPKYKSCKIFHCTEVRHERQSRFLLSDTTDFNGHLQTPNMTINMSAKTNCNFHKINLGSMFFGNLMLRVYECGRKRQEWQSSPASCTPYKTWQGLIKTYGLTFSLCHFLRARCLRKPRTPPGQFKTELSIAMLLKGQPQQFLGACQQCKISSPPQVY